jgi:hypothetical protein
MPLRFALCIAYSGECTGSADEQKGRVDEEEKQSSGALFALHEVGNLTGIALNFGLLQCTKHLLRNKNQRRRSDKIPALPE